MPVGEPDAGPDVPALNGATPLAFPHQLLPLSHLSGIGTHVSALFVEGRIRKYCGGLPTRIMKVDQAPSLPSQTWLGGTEKALEVSVVGTFLVSRKAGTKDIAMTAWCCQMLGGSSEKETKTRGRERQAVNGKPEVKETEGALGSAINGSRRTIFR